MTTKRTISDQWFSKFNITVYDEKDNLLKSISANIARYKLRCIHQELCNKQKTFNTDGDAEERVVLLDNIKRLKQQEQELAKQLGITIL